MIWIDITFLNLFSRSSLNRSINDGYVSVGRPVHSLKRDSLLACIACSNMIPLYNYLLRDYESIGLQNIKNNLKAL